MKGNELDFDTPAERRFHGSLKWNAFKDRDVLPMWVADMDFRSPEPVIEALKNRVEHGIFGYTVPTRSQEDAVLRYLSRDFGWEADPQWLVWLPGLVTGINVACRAAGNAGDAVMTTVPAYPPFLSAPGYQGRTLITVPMTGEQGRYVMDFNGMREAVTQETRLFILCSPHNPTGRLFEREELETLAAFCEENDLIVCSDEIHNGILLETGKPHIPLATLNPETARRTITLMAPSKTYNIPGLGCSFAVIPEPSLRRRFEEAMAGIVPHVNALGFVAAEAAYNEGNDWLRSVLVYLRENHRLVLNAVASMRGLSMKPAEATYLAWIDARETGMENTCAFFEAAGVGLSDGRFFGAPGFVRLNFGCSRKVLMQGLSRMQRALADAG